MPTRNVVITAHQSQLIDEWVAAGHYQNASEVLREGLRLVEQQKLEYRVRLEALRQAVDIGIADFDAGNFQTFDSAGTLEADLAALTSEALGVA